MTEEYVQQLCRVALGTILASQNKEDSYPCTSIQSSAVDTLLEVLQKYIERIGLECKNQAELAGRTNPYMIDLFHTIEKEPYSLNLSRLKVLTTKTASHLFPKEIAPFPQHKRRRLDVENNTVGHPASVPEFFPPLPQEHTYRHLRKNVIERPNDGKHMRLELLAQKRHLRTSLHDLLNYHQRIRSNAGPTMLLEDQNHLDETTTNPFLQPPETLNPTKEQRDRGMENHTSSFSRRPLKSSDGSSMRKGAQEQGKEERILSGTFYEGDSE